MTAQSQSQEKTNNSNPGIYLNENEVAVIVKALGKIQAEISFEALYLIQVKTIEASNK